MDGGAPLNMASLMYCGLLMATIQNSRDYTRSGQPYRKSRFEYREEEWGRHNGDMITKYKCPYRVDGFTSAS